MNKISSFTKIQPCGSTNMKAASQNPQDQWFPGAYSTKKQKDGREFLIKGNVFILEVWNYSPFFSAKIKR